MHSDDLNARFSFSSTLLQILISSTIFLEKAVLIHQARKLPVNGRLSLEGCEH
jgi:hypothetical protein